MRSPLLAFATSDKSTMAESRLSYARSAICHRAESRSMPRSATAARIATRTITLVVASSAASENYRQKQPGGYHRRAEAHHIVAGEQGFEPQLPDPESGVLPLDDSPSSTTAREYSGSAPPRQASHIPCNPPQTRLTAGSGAERQCLAWHLHSIDPANSSPNTWWSRVLLGATGNGR